MMDRKPLELPRVTCPEARFRILDGQQVEVAIHERVVQIPLSVHQLLLEFAAPRSARDVYEQLELGLEPAQFAEVVWMLDHAGVLIAPGAAPGDHADDASFATDIAGGVLDDPEVGGAVAASLAAGRAVTIRDALNPDLAEALYRELGEVSWWQPSEGAVARHGFHFRHHNLFDEERFPPALKRCARLFGSAGTKTFLTRLSGQDCEGTLRLGASLYLPGDYSLPHSDSAAPRSVAFVLHLTKDWDPGWGGALFWCPSGLQIVPGFNRLTLFNVTATSTHFVTPVSAHATGRRLAVNGWWTRREDAPAHADRASRSAPPDGILGECYGAAPHALGAARRIVVL
jgi:hypothetical protein